MRTQHGVDHDRAQSALGISEQAARVLEARGWTEPVLDEPGEPRPAVEEAPAVDGGG